MPVILRKFNLAYFSAPKNAGTSLRHFFFELENGFPFPSFTISGKTVYLHTLYQGKGLENSFNVTEGMHRLAVVRDPLDRFVSAYRSRVLSKEEIRTASFEKHGIASDIPKEPTLNEFVTHLPEYRRIAPIRSHTAPQVMSIGKDLSRFDLLYPFERVDEIPAMIRELTGRDIALRHEQRTDGLIGVSVLSDESKAMLREFYRDDYEALRGIYA